MFFKNSDGAKLFCRWAGAKTGPVLLLSHSLGASSRMWAPQTDALGRHFRLLLHDHRGHGRSAAPKGDLSIEQFGEDTLALMDSLKLEKVLFCGLSLGGMIGLWLAIHAGKRLERLIVCNTAARIADTALLARRIRHIRHEGLAAIADNVLERWLTAGFRAARPETIAWVRAMFAETASEGYAAGATAVRHLDLENALERIQTPTLVIAGKKDQATPPAWNALIARRVPGARLAELDAAHLSNIEAAEAFNRTALDFLLEGSQTR